MNKNDLYVVAAAEMFKAVRTKGIDVIGERGRYVNLRIPKNYFEENIWNFYVENKNNFDLVCNELGMFVPIYEIVGDILYTSEIRTLLILRNFRKAECAPTISPDKAQPYTATSR